MRPGFALALCGIFLLGLYLFASFGLAPNVDLLRFSSGILDMDTSRMVRDWATSGSAVRASLHPLSKLLLAPIGIALRENPPSAQHALDATRLMVACSMALDAVLVGWLAVRLSGGVRWAGVAAAVISGVSFCSILMGATPESASVACLSAVVPLLLLDLRFDREFSFAEAVGWGFVGVLSIAFTVSQGSWWLVALGTRVGFLLHTATERRGAALRLAPRLFVALTLCVAVTWWAADLQARIYPGTHAFEWAPGGREAERAYLRLDDLQQRTLWHGARLLAHFLFYDFAAPFPTYSSFLIDYHRVSWWSLSIEETRFHDWQPLQLVSWAALLIAFVPVARGMRHADRRFVAPLVGLGGQLALHAVYGREYVLYAANWHGVLVATAIAAASKQVGARWRHASVIVALLAAILLVNNLLVMQRIYAEFGAGLESSVRDARGALIPASRKEQPAR